MVKLGQVKRVIDDETIQVIDMDDDELYEVKGSRLSIEDIKESIHNNDFFVVEFDDESMQMVD
jgi:hypothetical protein